jgi:hypothetical protein
LAKQIFIQPMKVKYSIANVFRKLELLVCGSIAGQLDGVAKLFFLLKMLVKLQVYICCQIGADQLSQSVVVGFLRAGYRNPIEHLESTSM